jgi:copper chaperone CopZ
MHMVTITLKVAGMSCMGCVASVSRLLNQVPGVSRVAVDLAGGTAEVDYDPARASPDALRRAIIEGGYQAD